MSTISRRTPYTSIDYGVSKHEAEISNFFGPRLRRQGADYEDDIVTVFICFTNRCGSNYFCSQLASTGYLNQAQELFNYDEVIRISTNHDIKHFSDYCAALKRSDQNNGYFLVKAGADQLLYLAKLGFLEDVLAPARFVHVERSDILGQAISFVVALQNKQWDYHHEAAISEAELEYDEDDIQARINYICWANDLFRRFFALNGIVSYHVNYEHFLQHPHAMALDFFKWLGIENFPFDQSRVLKKQGSPVKAEWRDRFLSGDSRGTS